MLLTLAAAAFASRPTATANGDTSGRADAARPSPTRPSAETEPPFLRGMNVSCPRAGQIWATPWMSESLRELAALGVEWVAIHPYAGVRRDGSMRITPAADTGFLRGAVEIAGRQHMKLFWKPHLAYWGSFAWRGDIAFGDDPTAWRRFFDRYRSFIVDQARFAEAAHVPLFAVGTELDATVRHEREWRAIIAEVRRVYSGRLTYAANWDRFGQVPFWDALDWIGVQAYFPVSDRADPDRAAIAAGWKRHLDDLEALSRRLGKKVLFTEIGYDRSAAAAREPWRRGETDGPPVRELRRRLIEVALDRLPREPWLAGLFWWKWMPGDLSIWDRGDRDFSMRAEEARQPLARFWGAKRRAPVAAR